MKALTSEENEAIIKSIMYWIDKWDFECSTLFGLEKSDMEVIARDWTNSLAGNTEQTLIACLGSLREILYGASALPKTKIVDVLGISSEQAQNLCSVIYNECSHAL